MPMLAELIDAVVGTFPVEATEVTGEERDELWRRLVAMPAGFRRLRDQDLTHLPHVRADAPLVAPTNRTPSSTDASSYRLAAMGRTGVHLLRPHQPEPSARAVHDPALAERIEAIWQRSRRRPTRFRHAAADVDARAARN